MQVANTQGDGWTVSIDAAVRRRALRDDQVEQLVELFSDFAGAVAHGPGTISVTFSINADELQPAAEPIIVAVVDYACQIFTLHLAAIGEADWVIVSAHARTFEEHDNELREKHFTV
jgi:hypothetical protein